MITALLLDDDRQRDALRDALLARGDVVHDGTAGCAAADVVVIADPPGISKVREVRASQPRVPIVYVATTPQDLHATSTLVHALGVAAVEQPPIEPAAFVRRLVALVEQWRESVVGRRDVAAELANLRAGFLARLPARFAELAEAIAASRVSATHLETAQRLAHQLSGTVGAYGHPSLSETLAALERVLDVGPDADLEQLLARARAYVLAARP